jgi:ubiquinone/menaquinone biosynthesis C-methylase UbiE
MQRIDAPEILDSDDCSPVEVTTSMKDIGRVNRWFGGVATTQKMIERAAQATGVRHLSLLEVAAGGGEVPQIVQRKLERRGIDLDVTLLDRAQSHLPPRTPAVVGDGLILPFADDAFDLVSCVLFAHHLDQHQLAHFVREGLRVSRRAVLINDLVRHPAHLALAFAGFPLMRSRVAWRDGLTSVRRAYVEEEIRSLITASFADGAQPQIETSRNYLYRMGVIVWKREAEHRSA